MSHLKFLIAMLPVVFMLHDFEEIIMFKPWLVKNREELKSRFPKFENSLTKRSYFEYSTSAFAVAVMNEFALISLVTFFFFFFEFRHALRRWCLRQNALCLQIRVKTSHQVTFSCR